MTTSRFLFLGLGSWAGATLQRLAQPVGFADGADGADASSGAADSRFGSVDVRSSVPRTESPVDWLSIPPPGPETRRAVAGEGPRDVPAQDFLPLSWLEEPSLRSPGALDDRHAFRHAFVAAEEDLRPRVEELSGQATRVLVLAAADELIVSAGLVRMLRWLGDGPRVELLLALEPVGGEARRQPERGARLQALLSELDRALGAAEPLPLSRVMLIGRDGSPRDDLGLLAAEIATWWREAHRRPAHGLLDDELGSARWRNRPCVYRTCTAATASLDHESLVRRRESSLVDELGRLVLHRGTQPDGPTKEDWVTAPVAEIEASLDRALGQLESREVPVGHLAKTVSSARELDAILEAEHARAEAPRRRARNVLFGMAPPSQSPCAEGSFGKLLQSYWRLIAEGRASFEQVIGLLSGLAMAVDPRQLEGERNELAAELDGMRARTEHVAGSGVHGKAAAHAKRVVEDLIPNFVKLARAREEGTLASLGLVREHEAIEAAARLARCELRLEFRQELRSEIGAANESLLEAAGRFRSLGQATAGSARPRPQLSPWLRLLPVDGTEVDARLAAAGLDAASFLRDMASRHAEDVDLGLGRPMVELAWDVERHVHGHVEALVLGSRVGGSRDGTGGAGLSLPELPGAVEKAAAFFEGLPPSAVVDEARLPPGRHPHVETVLFHAGEDRELAESLAMPPRVVEVDGGARIGWLQLTGPLPLAALPALEQNRELLLRAQGEGRLLPRRDELGAAADGSFHDALPPDVFSRYLSALRRRGLDARLSEACAARLSRGEWSTRSGELAELTPFPRDEPALRLLGELAEWSQVDGLSELAEVDASARRIETAREADGSDEGIVAACLQLARVAVPVRAALAEGGRAPSRVFENARRLLEEATVRARGLLAGAEVQLLERVAGRWSRCLARAIARLGSGPRPAVRLTAHRLAAAGGAALPVELTNTGDGTAHSPCLRVLADEDLGVLGDVEKRLERLEAGGRAVLELTVAPRRAGSLPVTLELSWTDAEGTPDRLRHVEEVEFVDELPAFRRIDPNPHVAGPPVRSSGAFFGREDDVRFVEQNVGAGHEETVLFLHGRRRTGKSSLLCQLEQREDLKRGCIAVRLDLQALGPFDTGGVLHRLARQASRGLAAAVGVAPHEPSRESFGLDPSGAFHDALDGLDKELARTDRRLLLMLDHVDALARQVEDGGVSAELLPLLHSLPQERERISLLLAGSSTLAAARGGDRSGLLSMASVRELRCLGEAEARSLITEPTRGWLQFDDLAVESLLRMTGRHPYCLQLACRVLVERMNARAETAWVDASTVEELRADLTEASAAHFAEAWEEVASLAARRVLEALAVRDETEHRWFGPDELREVLPMRRAEDGDTNALMGELVRDELVDCRTESRTEPRTETGGEGPAWRLRSELFRLWIRDASLRGAGRVSGPSGAPEPTREG